MSVKKLAGVYTFLDRNPKLRLHLQNQDTIFLLIFITIPLNIEIDKFVYRSDLETSNLASFLSKSLNYRVIKLFVQKLLSLTVAKFFICTGTDITFQTSVKKVRAVTMGSAFSPSCGYENSNINLIENVYCRNTKCSAEFCLQKKTLCSVDRSNYQCRKARLCAMFAIFFWRSNKSLSLVVLSSVYILKRFQNQFKMLLEIYIVLASNVSTERNANLFTVVTTPRFNCGCGKYGAWFFVEKVLFTIREHVKTTKKDETRFNLLKKWWTCYPTNNSSIMSHFKL